MSRSLTRLPQANFSGLDYDNLMQDIINLVTDNPDYNENWDDFLSSNAGRMLIELFSYITDQLATRIDWIGNENFIGTATQKASVMRILKIIGYNFTLPISATVSIRINVSLSDWGLVGGDSGGYYLTAGYENGDTGWAPFSITTVGKDGSTKIFELLNYNSNTGIYNYTTSISVEEQSVTLPFYEGETIVDTFTAETDNNPIFTLTQTPVIENSVLIRLIGDSGGSTIESDLLEVDSFLDSNAQREQYTTGEDIPIPYILNVLENDVVTVEFGPTSLLNSSTRRLSIGQQIRAIYRIGGGINGNIVSQAVNTSSRLLVNPIGGGAAQNITVNFINTYAASGGSNGETAEHASVYAPLQIRTVDKAVTTEDYEILLEAHENVLVSKSYGSFNLPSDIYELYGLYIRPMEVWNYIVPNTSGYETVNTSEYNDFQWMTFRLENRFNGIYDFTEGVFNNSASVTNSDMNIGDTFIDWWGDTDFTWYQEVGLSFYNGDSLSGLVGGDSYSFVVNGDSFNFILTGDSTYSQVVTLMNSSRAGGDSWLASVVGDTGSMDIRVSIVGDTTKVTLNHPDGTNGDTLWVNLTGWVAFDTTTSDNFGDSFRNFIIVNTPQAMITSVQNAIQGDSYFRLKVSTTGDTSQQLRNILDLVVGDSLYGDSAHASTWRISDNINAYLQSSRNAEAGIDMTTNYQMKLAVDRGTGGDSGGIGDSGDSILWVTVNLKAGAVDPSKVRSYEIMYNINRAFFFTLEYGDSGGASGDTRYGDSTGLVGVASVVEASSGAEYIKLTSPSTGDSSFISIEKLSQYDIGDSVFGTYVSGDTGDTFHCYGVKKLTMITNINHDDFGKLIYEPATLNLTETLYLHYLNNNENSIFIGDYYYNNYTEGVDLKWREKARRIYNSYYETSGDSTVTVTSSEFQLKFTKGDTVSMALWSIANEWDLALSSYPIVQGDTDLGDTVYIPSSKRYLKVNVDAKGDTILDLWGETGSPGDSYFDPDDVAFNLNTHLQNSYTAEGSPYINYTYFTVVQNKMVMKGPTITNSSYIKLKPTTSDGGPTLFGSSVYDGGDTTTFTISGDYFLEYDSATNMMKLTRTTDTQMPDLNFRCHFIYDRRFETDGNLIEDTYDSFLENKKIIGVENVFKQTRFSAFDLDGIIHFNSSYTVGQVSAAVENALQEEYALIDTAGNSKRGYGEKVFRSKILDLIQSVSGVEYVELTYFGKDATTSSTAVTDYIDCKFDEIILLSENIEINNILSHGILFNYEVTTS